MKKKALAISIVIPVFNEEDYLKACLDSIARQTLMPKEVIVVDNNCTDRTIDIAKEYSFVRVIEESNQGRIYACRKGFDAATGDIIGRIDADTVLSHTWAEQVRAAFTDNSIEIITGRCYFYDFPLKKLTTLLHTVIYYYVQRIVGGGYASWGSNMAFKQSAWKKLSKQQEFTYSSIHEDIDLSLKLRRLGIRTALVPSLLAEVSMRRGKLGPITTAKYFGGVPQVYWHNKYYLNAFFVAVVWLAIYLICLPLLLVRALLQFFDR